MLGYTEDELLGMTSTDIVHPDYRFTDAPKYLDPMLKGTSPTYASERKFLRKDGSSIWVNRTVSMAHDASGKPLYFIRIIEDITERKRSDEILAQERGLLRTIIDAIPDLIYVKDRSGKFLLANRTWLAHRGKPDNDISGKTVHDFFPQEIAYRMERQDTDIVNTGAPLLDVEQRMITTLSDGKSSRVRWANTSKVPLQTATGEIIGTVGISRDITAEKESENRRMMAHEVTRLLAESTTLTEAMPKIIGTICKAMGWAYGARWSLNAKDQQLVRVDYWCEFEPEFDPADHALWLSATYSDSGRFLRRAWTEKTAIWLTNLQDGPFRRKASAVKLGWHSAYAFPIQMDSQIIGIMEFFGSDIRESDDGLVQTTTAISSQIGQFIQRKEAEDRIVFLAQFDAVTDLPNRFLFGDRLSQLIVQSQRNDWSAGVLFVDLDRFKLINDNYGHAAGDELLRQVAKRMQECVRRGDTVGRLSGDEFAVMLANLAKTDDSALVAQKIVDSLAMPFNIHGHQTYISASIGIAIYPGDGNEPDTLLKNADTAMYRAKEQGRNGYQFYLPEMNERLILRQKLEAELHGALDRNEFLLHYQPKVSLVTGDITGFEALLRWQHDDKLVAPVEFITILEENGLIVPVGEWVLRHVCMQIKQWGQAGFNQRSIAVNLSARQFQRKNLVDTVGQALRESGINPALLELELTESLLMSDAKEAIDTLHQLKRLGVQLSVDDFGTGYSSLAYLKRFPLDELKIDREFIRDATSDADDASIVLTIITLAHSLNLRVVAEGVETEGQLNFLRTQGCDAIQGYYFSRPMPVAVCTGMLAENKRLAQLQRKTASNVATILLVIDKDDEMQRLTQAFISEGFQVLAAKNANDGFEILARQEVNIVVSDNDMPEISGIEYLARVRKLHPGLLRILVSSGDDTPTLTHATNRAGIHLFLPKHWAPEHMGAEVREALQTNADALAASGQHPVLQARQE